MSNCYRVTDLPQLTDLNNQDLFLISHLKDQYGNYESRSIPFCRLMNAVKRRGFNDEIALLNELNETALRENDLSSYAKKQEVTEMGEAAKTYIDGEIAKIHTHANKAILDQISTLNVSQFVNDVGYLSAHQSLSGYASKLWVGEQGFQKKTVFRDWIES